MNAHKIGVRIWEGVRALVGNVGSRVGPEMRSSGCRRGLWAGGLGYRRGLQSGTEGVWRTGEGSGLGQGVGAAPTQRHGQAALRIAPPLQLPLAMVPGQWAWSHRVSARGVGTEAARRAAWPRLHQQQQGRQATCRELPEVSAPTDLIFTTDTCVRVWTRCQPLPQFQHPAACYPGPELPLHTHAAPLVPLNLTLPARCYPSPRLLPSSPTAQLMPLKCLQGSKQGS